MRRRLGRFGDLLRRFRADTAGAVVVIVAILSPVLIGAMGLGAETGFWYLTQRKLQNAADLAVHGAAKEMAGGQDADAMQRMGEYLAAQAEINLATASVAINNPPASGSYAGDDGAVEAVLTQALPRMFSAIYSSEPVPIGARAVALLQAGGVGCVLALNRGASDAILATGASGSTLTQCDMVSNGGFVMSGTGASVSANCIQTAGTAVTTANLTVNCDRIRQNVQPLADPFAGVVEPDGPTAVPCHQTTPTVGQNNTATSVTADSMHESGMLSRRFCGGLDLRGTVTFSPGLYLIEGGDFVINANTTVIGDGVVFYLANGRNMRFSGTAVLDLSAPVSGPYAGMIIFGSRSSTTASHQFNGNVGSTLDGAIYTPSSHLTVSGSAQTSTNGCTQLVTGTVEFTGGGDINISCTDPAGPTIEMPPSVTLVE